MTVRRILAVATTLVFGLGTTACRDRSAQLPSSEGPLTELEICLDAPGEAALRCRPAFELAAAARAASTLEATTDADHPLPLDVRADLLEARWHDALDDVDGALGSLDRFVSGCEDLTDPAASVRCLDHPARRPWRSSDARVAARRLLDDQLARARGLARPELLNEVLEVQATLLRRREPEPAFDRLQETIALRVERGADDKTDFANLLRARGTLRARLGDYVGAYEDLAAAAVRFETAGETGDRRYTLLRAELGHLLLELGDLQTARRSLTEGLRSTASERGPTDRAVGEVAGFLVDVQVALGDGASALDALEIAEAASTTWSGPQRWRRGRMHLRRAEVELLRGHAEEAALAVDRAIEILDDTHAAFHLVADAYEIRGRILQELDRWSEAEIALERALELKIEALGPEHARTALSRTLIAELHLRRGDLEAAIPLAVRAEEQWQAVVRRAIAAFSERQILHLGRRHARGRDLVVVAAARSGSPSHRRLAWDLVAGSRLWALEWLTARAREAAAATAAEASETYARLGEARRELARLALQVGPPAGDPNVTLRELAARVEELERSLAGKIRTDRAGILPAVVNPEALRTALPESSALVSTARVRGPDGPDTYFAFVLRGGVREALDLISLGDAETLDTAISHWTSAVRRSSGGLRSAADLEQRQRELGTEVRRRIWDPLAHLLEDAPPERIFLVAEGALHRVAWGALPLDDGRYLLEEPISFHVLNAERELLSAPSRRNVDASLGDLLAIGDPRAAEEAPFPSAGSDAGTRGPDGCDWPPSAGFEPLPGARREAELVTRTWQEMGGRADLRLGPDAGFSSVLERAPTARVVHFATHAYLVPPGCRSTPLRERLDTPLLVSGLVLASPGSGTPTENVSSLTLAALPLDADLVVLSGCETGVGDPLALEGVLGLRTALHRAGARSLLTSLWPLVDEEGADWLVTFYRAWGSGTDLDRAARQASLEALEELRAEGRPTLPALWSPFVTVGAWSTDGS